MKFKRILCLAASICMLGTIAGCGEGSAGESKGNISAGDEHTVGLKKDGTVVAVGENRDGQCEVSEWENIIAVSAGDDHTVFFESDGVIISVKFYKNFIDVTKFYLS